MEIGEELVNAIIKGKLFTATCPDSPESSCVIVWAANAYEQLTQLVREHVECRDDFDDRDCWEDDYEDEVFVCYVCGLPHRTGDCIVSGTDE